MTSSIFCGYCGEPAAVTLRLELPVGLSENGILDIRISDITDDLPGLIYEVVALQSSLFYILDMSEELWQRGYLKDKNVNISVFCNKCRQSILYTAEDESRHCESCGDYCIGCEFSGPKNNARQNVINFCGECLERCFGDLSFAHIPESFCRQCKHYGIRKAECVFIPDIVEQYTKKGKECV
jgi:hypothetical protein